MSYIKKFEDPETPGWYLDADGVSYQDASEFLAGGVFKWCGCGMKEEALIYVRDILSLIRGIEDSKFTKEAWNELQKYFKSYKDYYFALYWMDNLGLTQHGGSVPGWLTEKGEAILFDLLALNLEDNEPKEA